VEKFIEGGRKTRGASILGWGVLESMDHVREVIVQNERFRDDRDRVCQQPTLMRRYDLSS